MLFLCIIVNNLRVGVKFYGPLFDNKAAICVLKNQRSTPLHLNITDSHIGSAMLQIPRFFFLVQDCGGKPLSGCVEAKK